MKRIADAIRGNLSVSLSALILALLTLVMFFINITSALLLSAVFVLFVVLNVALDIRMRGMQKREQYTRALSPLLIETVSSLTMPVIIIAQDNALTWFNNEFAAITDARKIHLGDNIGGFFGGMVSYAGFVRAIENGEMHIELKTGEDTYWLHLIPCSYLSKKFVAAVWESRREAILLQNKFIDSSVRIANIAVDNSAEIREVHDNYRDTATKIAIKLAEWAESINGILIENEQDSFILEFDNRYLADMISSRFDILDRIAEVSGESVLPLTISIGISSTSGTLAEKAAEAKSALNSAYQRGGASVVVRTEGGEQVYGGRSKPVQSQSPTRSRVCKEILKRSIREGEKVLIFGHARPDFDSVASCIGLSAFVRANGGVPQIVIDTEEVSVRPVFDLIRDDSEFDGLFIDRVFGQELLKPETLVIISDVSNPDIFEAPDIYKNANSVIIIDHHAMRKNLERNVTHMYIDPSASSASEMVSEICELELKQTYLGTTTATLLLAGILLDTNSFMRDTGARTFAACRYLSKEGAEPSKASALFKDTLDETRIVTETVNRLSPYKERFAISLMTAPDNDSNKVTASKAAEKMMGIAGINASFVLYYSGGAISLSARSDQTVNVSAIAKLVGGGGHYQSAGANICEVLDDGAFGRPVTDMATAKAIITDAIDKYLSI